MLNWYGHIGYTKLEAMDGDQHGIPPAVAPHSGAVTEPWTRMSRMLSIRFLLNPRHEDAGRVTIESSNRHPFDVRLFRDR